MSRRILVVESCLRSVQENTRQLSHAALMLHAEIIADDLLAELRDNGCADTKVTAEVFFV